MAFLRENANPVFINARYVPFALREAIDQEIDELVRDGIIEKVDQSDWGSPVVPSADYKVAVNK